MNGLIKNDSNKGSHFDWMECGIVFAGVLVVVGLLMESWPEIKLAVNEGRLPKVPVTGEIIVTIGVLIEVVLGIFITQRANRVMSEAKERVASALAKAGEAEQAAAEANLARVRLEEQLLRAIGPRRLTPQQREHISVKVSERLPTVSFILLVIATKNIEDTKECVDFAWEISDALTNGGKEAPVYTVHDLFAWKANDIWVRLPSPAWSDVGRVIFFVLKEEHLKVAGSVPVGLPPVLWRTERNGGGTSIATPDVAKDSIGIVVAKRSQPVFRLEE